MSKRVAERPCVTPLLGTERSKSKEGCSKEGRGSLADGQVDAGQGLVGQVVHSVFLIGELEARGAARVLHRADAQAAVCKAGKPNRTQ